MNCYSYNLFFEVISPELRLRIIHLLMKGPKSVKEISSSLNEEQSKVSHSLRVLKQCNFLDVKSEGKNRIYSVNRETIVPLMKLVEKHVKKYCTSKCCMKRK